VIDFKRELQDHFKKMTDGQEFLFMIDIDKDKLWNTYLDSFPEGTNEIFRERRYMDCGACRQFIKAFGNVVTIQDNKITTIWDFKPSGDRYKPVVKSLSKFIKSKKISDVFFSPSKKIGTDKNFEEMTDGTITRWDHMYLELDSKYVHKGSKSIADVKGQYRDVRNVFKRSLDEINEDSVLSVLELISSNTLYKGEEWKTQLQKFLEYKKEYVKLSKNKKEIYAWIQSTKIGPVIGKIRNHSIGTLLVNISDDMDLDQAVRKYEAIVAPTNYKRPKAIYSKKMIDAAKKKIDELGFIDSLERRFATLDDITVNNILFSNKDSAKRMAGKDVFDEMKDEVATDPKKFSKIDSISIDDFITNVLPTAEEIELLFENKHSANLMSLIAPVNNDSKSMLKWNNNFSWSYTGNITDSDMKDRVKSAGGDVTGDLRFSIQWNDMGEDIVDLDAHCLEMNKMYKIYYSNARQLSPNNGVLDVDIITPSRNTPAVENITYVNRRNMKDGVYKFSVHNFSSNNGAENGFRAEIEYDGKIQSFDYSKPTHGNETIDVAEVTLKDGIFTIKELINSTASSKITWNVNTNQFIPVSVVMNSPNYWDEQTGIGHKHIFFMLKNCVNSETPNGFFNEFLQENLMEHKKVFEALGSKMKVADTDDQLSGIGFSTTKRNEIILKIKAKTERILKIIF